MQIRSDAPPGGLPKFLVGLPDNAGARWVRTRVRSARLVSSDATHHREPAAGATWRRRRETTDRRPRASCWSAGGRRTHGALEVTDKSAASHLHQVRNAGPQPATRRVVRAPVGTASSGPESRRFRGRRWCGGISTKRSDSELTAT